jgi:hypothetical protein
MALSVVCHWFSAWFSLLVNVQRQLNSAKVAAILRAARVDVLKEPSFH